MSDPARIGKYEIRGTLGYGAMGTVYRGFDPLIGRLAAIKMIRRSLLAADLDGKFLERFRNEARAAGRLAHPNIVTVYEYGEDAADAYIAMEFVEGVDLAHYLSGRSALGLDQSVALVSQLLSALDYAHQAGVVHRDVKPSNLLIAADGRLKIGDFGIARIGASHLTATGAVMGTPAYMSPEQCRGVTVDARSDLFSAAVVLYELVTGRKPFDGPSEALAYKICHDDPLLPSAVALQLHAAFDALLTTALAKDVDRRFQSASEFRAALHESARIAGIPLTTHDVERIPMETRALPTVSTVVSVGNLPQPLDAFIGRERELTDVGRMLQVSRLLTLVGAGGLGKTRLALEAAARLRTHYADGAWLVELAPLDDERLVDAALASVLNLKDEPDRPIRESLVTYLRDREILLVLDNCEHLARRMADLASELLRSCARLTIVATSREPLHVAGETAYAVSPLAIPDLRAELSVSALASVPAVRLFVERARAAQASFAINPRNAQAIADICHRLDGIPLALELAAARVRSLSVETIDSRLDDRFRLLKGGDHTALPRQQTLRAMIDWSFDALSEPQRSVFRRLAVFAGGFSLDAAEAVVAGGNVEADDVLDLVAELVDKSLLSLDPEPQRYRFLQTIRHYASDKLNESGESHETRASHIRYYVALAEEADPKLLGPEQDVWHARLDSERENLIAAHANCTSTPGCAQDGLRLVHALRTWFRRGSTELASTMGREAVAREGAQARTITRCQALFTTAGLCYFAGRYEDAERYAQESLDIARENGDVAKICDALAMIGLTSLGRGDTEASRSHLEQAVAIGREMRDPTRLHQALNCLAEAESMNRDFAAALEHYDEALTIARASGAADTILITLLNLVRVRIDCALLTEAATLLRDAVPRLRSGAGDSEYQQFVTVATGLASGLADWHRAAWLFGFSEALYARGGARREPADQAFIAPLVERARAGLGDSTFAACAAEGRSVPTPQGLADTITWLTGENITISARCSAASRGQ